jgi:competence protein ComEC
MRYRIIGIASLAAVIAIASCSEPSAPLGASEPTASILSVTLEGPGGDGAYMAEAVWTQCPDDDFAWYAIYRSQSPDVSSNPGSADTSIVFPAVSSTSWTDSSIVEGQTYYYALRTVNSDDMEAWSNEETIQVPPSQPPTASVLSGSYTGSGTFGQISLSWTQCPDGDFQLYKLYRADFPDIRNDTASAQVVGQIGDVTELSLQDNNVEGLTTYYYALLTLDVSGLGAWSNEISVSTPDLTPRLTVFFIDPSYGSYSGDAILLRTPSNRHYLIDGGDRGSGWSCGLDRVLPLMDSLGVDSLDGIVGTHPHSDHIGGLIGILESVPVGVTWDSGFPYTTSTYYDYLDAIYANGCDYVTPRRGDILDWDDDLLVECLHPADPLGDDANDASIVLRVTFQDVTFLFTGDLETDDGEESVLLALSQGGIDDLSADVLKVGHHGSSTSTSIEWLTAVDPDYAAIEVGYGNPYGHPHGEVINRLQNYGVTIFRTDLDGTFVMTTDGTDLQVYP